MCFRHIAKDDRRNEYIMRDIIQACGEGRKIIVLTNRTEQVESLRKALRRWRVNYFALHGRLSRKRRVEVLAELSELDESAPRVILATVRLAGERVDHPTFDTLVLAPISWKGTLQQYAGRLHQDHAHKRDVRIYDSCRRRSTPTCPDVGQASA